MSERDDGFQAVLDRVRDELIGRGIDPAPTTTLPSVRR